MKIFGTSADGRNGLRLTRINVKQSQEIEKVYEADRYANSGDYINQQAGIGKFWSTKDNPPESSSIQKLDYSNRGKTLNLNRNFGGRKRTSPAHKKKKNNKFIPKIKPKFENDSTATRKDTKDRKFEKEKLKEYNNTFKRTKKGNSSETRPAIPRNIIERIKLGNKFTNNDGESMAYKAIARKRFSTMSVEIKPDRKQKIVKNDKNKTVSKIYPLNNKFKSKNAKINTDSKRRIETTKTMAEKVKNIKDLKLNRFNNQSRYKLDLLGVTNRTKQKSINFKKEDKETKTSLGRTSLPLKNTVKTSQGIKTLSSKEEKRNEDMNVADIINSFIKLPIHIQKRVIDQVLLRQRNFEMLSDTVTLPGESSIISIDLSEKYSKTSILPKIYNTATVLPNAYLTTSVDLPAVYITMSVLPKAYRAILFDSSTAYATTSALPKAYTTTPVLPKANRSIPVDSSTTYIITSVLPKTYRTASIDFPETHTTTSVFPKAYNTTLVGLTESYNTTSVFPTAYSTTYLDLPEAHNHSETYSTESEDFPESSMTTSFDLSEAYSIGSEDSSEAYNNPSLDLSEGYGTSSVGATDTNLEASTPEEIASQIYKNQSFSETPEEKKFKSEMLKEYYETYSIPPIPDDSIGSLDVRSIPEEKSVRRRFFIFTGNGPKNFSQNPP
ncbi:hypothetical protein HNY73_006855 [Argiope bruennichi]|uniref:Uncharacterized protein n=1 Tax=Argiope bruennichi TaxID=94029 RepID=A0A8T0FF64_ARGBR|nr:hypothetical protein HNY73_006855 [Argiope bruennichi]